MNNDEIDQPCPSLGKFTLHPLIHTLLKFSLTQHIGWCLRGTKDEVLISARHCRCES